MDNIAKVIPDEFEYAFMKLVFQETTKATVKLVDKLLVSQVERKKQQHQIACLCIVICSIRIISLVSYTSTLPSQCNK